MKIYSIFALLYQKLHWAQQLFYFESHNKKSCLHVIADFTVMMLPLMVPDRPGRYPSGVCVYISLGSAIHGLC